MELRTFVSQALVDIIAAVQDAQGRTPNGSVVPEGVANTMQAVGAGISQMQVIDFEVTVKADEREGSEARLSVVAAVIGGTVKGDSGKTGGHAATLRFRVPVSLPVSGPNAKQSK